MLATLLILRFSEIAFFAKLKTLEIKMLCSKRKYKAHANFKKRKLANIRTSKYFTFTVKQKLGTNRH